MNQYQAINCAFYAFNILLCACFEMLILNALNFIKISKQNIFSIVIVEKCAQYQPFSTARFSKRMSLGIFEIFRYYSKFQGISGAL